MRYSRDLHHRRSIRLQGHDYTQPATYFVTLVTYNREHLLGDVRDRQMHENGLGSIARTCWLAIPDHFPAVALDAFVVMPNHIHGIVIIHPRRGVQLNAPTGNNAPAGNYSSMSPRPGSLPVIIRTYKAAVTTQCRRAGHVGFAWQRNYYEHVIRDENDLRRIQEYIHNNPAQWDLDRQNPVHGDL